MTYKYMTRMLLCVCVYNKINNVNIRTDTHIFVYNTLSKLNKVAV